MAYPHTKYEVAMTTTAGGMEIAASASGIVAEWGPVARPHIIRGYYVVLSSSTTAWNPLTVEFNHLSLASGASATAIADNSSDSGLYAHSSNIQGEVLYRENMNVEIDPGEIVQLDITAVPTASASHLIRAGLYVEPRWEQPTNDATMIASPTGVS